MYIFQNGKHRIDIVFDREKAGFSRKQTDLARLYEKRGKMDPEKDEKNVGFARRFFSGKEE